jgi:type IV pilus assembly protein PilN
MPRINLLPWREEQRRERKLQFGIAVGIAAAGAAIVSFGAYLMLGSMISDQQARNERLRGEIKQKFIARMDIIEKLQRSRPEIVHIFDEIVRTLPDGTYLTGVKQTDKRLKFDGVAQSSTRVSTFMRNIDASEWMKNPELEVVETKQGQVLGSNFTLFADQVSTVASEDASSDPNLVARRGAGQ